MAGRDINPAYNHIPALDGLRGLAIALVIAVHCYYRGPNINASPIFSGILIFGWSGVELFFVLSGFLITSILAKSRSEGGTYRIFLLNRTARIAPLYFLVLTGFLLLSFLPLPNEAANPLQNYREYWFVYWFYISNFSDILKLNNDSANIILGPAWSLAIEQHFYLIWPIIVLRFSTKAAKSIISLCYLVLVVFRLFLVGHIDPQAIYHFTLFHFDGLAIGSLLALWLPSISKYRALAPAALVFSAASLLVLILYAGTSHYMNPLIQKWGYVAISTFYGCLIISTITSAPMERIFSGKVLRIVGKYSYFTYLVHWPILLILDKLPLSGWTAWTMFFFLFTAITTALGSLCWRLFEKPMLDLIRGLAREKTSRHPS